ncbi:DISARM system phospholipase D-like protein DrmC [Leptolyngbya ohadii]|uniref:DISARM system phospholipase D-like protein DrmC n=1 Tax=Leptolyngbya ohadii TaxID=1962290 RepID=UPI000B59DCFF|nr:DISARM system phospholipase D-like protein DrmC [Leptolyngbya ohadii]
MSPFLKLSRPALAGLAAALETGRLRAPYSAPILGSFVPKELCRDVSDELNRLDAMGTFPAHIAYTLNLLAAERTTVQQVRDRVELVWTGQGMASSQSRDTAVVVRELFHAAQRSVLISSFAIDRGEKGRALFEGLAKRMDANPDLRVRLFLNVQRPHGNDEPESVLLKRFTHNFRKDIWAGNRSPEVFYDPRSLVIGTETRACLHAKCIVVDEERVLITSANFTEAAHERNIEAGVLLSDAAVAQAVYSQFESLVIRFKLKRIEV